MGKIVDLSVFEELTQDVKMPDGTELKLMKPTQRMVIEMLKFKDINEESKPQEIAQAVDKMVLQILNTNDEMKVFKASDVKDLNLPQKIALIQAYSEFITGIQSNPN